MDLSELQKDQPEQMVEQEKQVVPETPPTETTPTKPKSYLTPEKEELRGRLQSYLDGATQEKLSPLALAGMAFSALGARSRGQQVTLRNLIDEHESKRKQIAMQLLDRLNEESQQASVLEKQRLIEEERAKREEDKASQKVWTDRTALHRSLTTNAAYQQNPLYAESLKGMGDSIAKKDETGFLTAYNNLTAAQGETAKKEEGRKAIASSPMLQGLRTGKNTPQELEAVMAVYGLDPKDPANAQLLQAGNEAYQQGMAEKQQAQKLNQARLDLQRERNGISQQIIESNLRLREATLQASTTAQVSNAILRAHEDLREVMLKINELNMKLGSYASLDSGTQEQFRPLIEQTEASRQELMNLAEGLNQAIAMQEAVIHNKPGAPPPAPSMRKISALTPDVVQNTLTQAIGTLYPDQDANLIINRWVTGSLPEDADENITVYLSDVLNRVVDFDITPADIAASVNTFIKSRFPAGSQTWKKEHYLQDFIAEPKPNVATAEEMSSHWPAGTEKSRKAQELAGQVSSRTELTPPPSSAGK